MREVKLTDMYPLPWSVEKQEQGSVLGVPCYVEIIVDGNGKEVPLNHIVDGFNDKSVTLK